PKDHDQHPAGEVRQAPLQREADRQARRAEDGHERRRLDPDHGRDADQEQDPQPPAEHAAQKRDERWIEAPVRERPPQHGRDATNDPDAQNQRDESEQRLRRILYPERNQSIGVQLDLVRGFHVGGLPGRLYALSDSSVKGRGSPRSASPVSGCARGTSAYRSNDGPSSTAN